MEIDLKHCTLCPRNCGADRTQYEGYCRAGVLPTAALASVHQWEEPSISGTKGSGTVFFSNCNLKCIFCQNYEISSQHYGKEISIEHLADIFLSQQNKGVHNLNLVSPGHFLPQVRESLLLAKKKGLTLPVVYNTNGYEKAESLRLLEGLIDIYLPDIKYYSGVYSAEYSNAPDYFPFAAASLKEMVRQVGPNQFDEKGIMTKGVIIRHLVLPGLKEDSMKILDWIKDTFGDSVYVSLLNQYTPMYKAAEHKKISRRLTTFEYQKVVDYFLEIGLQNGYVQKRTSQSAAYTPAFDLSGI